MQDSEISPYTDGTQKYSIAAYRFSDATGAMAAWDAIRPADSKPIGLMGLSAQTDADAYVAAGNYLLIFKGYKIHPGRTEPCGGDGAPLRPLSAADTAEISASGSAAEFGTLYHGSGEPGAVRSGNSACDRRVQFQRGGRTCHVRRARARKRAC